MKHWNNARLCSCIWVVVPPAAENILNCNFLHILLGDEALKPQPEGKGKGLLLLSL